MSDEGVWIHLYDASTLDWALPDGRRIHLEQQTRYPWDGRVTLAVEVEGDRPASVFLRIPGWCPAPSIYVNGAPVRETARPGEFLEIRRGWKAGDRIDLDLGLEPELMVADPRVRDLAACVAVRRGPLIYCLEQPDNPGGPVLSARIRIAADPPGDGLRYGWREEFLGGIATIEADGTFAEAQTEDAPLYRPLGAGPPRGQGRLTFIPYYAWANREPSAMTVWLPTS